MKRLLFIMLVTVAIVGKIQAQQHYIVLEVPKFEVGLLAGFNRTTVTGSHDVRFSGRRTGVLAGIQFIRNFSRSSALNVEVLYNVRAWTDFSNLYGPVDTTSYQANMKYAHISIPLLGKFQIGESRHFTLEAGIQPSFGIGKANWEDGESDLSQEVTSRFKSFELGGVLGFGTKFQLGEQGNLYFKTRYYQGFTGQNNFDASDGKQFNYNSFQFLVGITRYLGK